MLSAEADASAPLALKALEILDAQRPETVRRH